MWMHVNIFQMPSIITRCFFANSNNNLDLEPFKSISGSIQAISLVNYKLTRTFEMCNFMEIYSFTSEWLHTIFVNSGDWWNSNSFISFAMFIPNRSRFDKAATISHAFGVFCLSEMECVTLKDVHFKEEALIDEKCKKSLYKVQFM